ncbi:HAD family phosphatase [Kutzneria buriramensis]|uniref:Putative hydrolase of the HAD superfamily n=1 Tax=Kutzneria buriramensis TaxID=1045776 RepID=A0A3E0HKL6_9PSEU|nr:HAD family phosphatase [Kutzneria buriramensis]REH47032.1 putative hydrolase of the HAD superfamily [Kutzneria buriramensis]
MPDVKAVWTDFGGVLTPPIAVTLQTFCQKWEVDRNALMAAVWAVTQRYDTTDVMLPLDTPLVSEQEWLGQVKAELLANGISLAVDSFADAWFGGREANAAWLARLRRARADGLFVGMLSNMVPSWDAHWRAMVPPDELFDDVLLSYQVGFRKPAKEIFDLAVLRSGVPAAQSVFVDDLEANCAGARAQGWRAIQFTDTDQAIARLDELLGTTGGAT